MPDPRLLCPSPRWISWRDGGDTPDIPVLPPQGYRLRVSNGSVHVDAGDEAGAFYAHQTAAQLERLGGGRVDDVEVVDWPDLPTRGVMLDVSRDKVPTVGTLELLIDRLASFKINHVELYLEHTFTYRRHEEVWRDASPFTAGDIARLRAFCAARHVQLVPQQNSLGHFERWLRHPRYTPLAALPGGYTSPFGGHEPAACLDPALPAAFDLVAELWTELAAVFDSPTVHLGLDEPIDLNPAVWDAIFDLPGVEAPWAGVDDGTFCVPLPEERLEQYVRWATRLRALPALHERAVLMWGDVVAAHPDVLDQLPDDVTIVEWGYEATHPFAARAGRIAERGRDAWVAPGTSSWSSIGGRITNMSANVAAASAAAAAHGATGLVVCDWGNEGHFQYLPVSWPGFAAAAARSWRVAPAAAPDLMGAVDVHLLGAPEAGRGLAAPLWQLGRAGDTISPQIPEASALASLVSSADAAVGLALGGMTPSMLDAAEALLADVEEAAASACSCAADAATTCDEIRTAARWLRFGVARARRSLDWEPAPDERGLRREHAELLDEHRRLWLDRNRPGGLDHSVELLAGML